MKAAIFIKEIVFVDFKVDLPLPTIVCITRDFLFSSMINDVRKVKRTFKNIGPIFTEGYLI